MPTVVGSRPSPHRPAAADRAPSPPRIRTVSSGSDGSHGRVTATHLTYSRHHLINTAHDTMKISEDGRYTNPAGRVVHVKEALDRAVERCVHYDHEFDFRAALQLHYLAGGGEAGALGIVAEQDEDDAMEVSDATNRSSNNGGGGGGSGRRSSGARRSKNSLAASLSSPTAPRGPPHFPRTSFLVVSASWLEAASELLGAFPSGHPARGAVGVLNSASGTTPGGRFLKGTVSQEDCLCRVSLLYACVSQPRFQMGERFYKKNRNMKYGSSNCIIFCPDVPVIREDTAEGKLLDDYEKVSFVNLPAPNAFTTSNNTGKEYNDNESHERATRLSAQHHKMSTNDLASMASDSGDAVGDNFAQKRTALLSSLSDRIHRALAAFVLGGCTDLVLPAFGCGVHGNDPELVAGVFRELLTDPVAGFGGRFRTVVFAIPPSRKQNYQAFAAYFQRAEIVAARASAGG